jgi:hypothetical protein
MSVAVTPNPNVAGPTGPTGPTGVTGTAGVTGATGPTLVGFNTQTGTTYTLVLDDKDKMVTLNNASAITLTVPPSIFSANDIVTSHSLVQAKSPSQKEQA